MKDRLSKQVLNNAIRCASLVQKYRWPSLNYSFSNRSKLWLLMISPQGSSRCSMLTVMWLQSGYFVTGSQLQHFQCPVNTGSPFATFRAGFWQAKSNGKPIRGCKWPYNFVLNDTNWKCSFTKQHSHMMPPFTTMFLSDS